MGRPPEAWRLTTLRGGIRGVRFSHGGIRYHRSTGERNPAAAKKRAAEIYRDICSKPPKKLQRASGLEDAISLWLASYQRRVLDGKRSSEWAATLELYAKAHWLSRWSRLEEITGPAIERYKLERREAGITDVTLRKELVGLRQLLKWAARVGYLAAVPEFEAPAGQSKESVCLSVEQIEALLAALPNREKHPKHLPVAEYYGFMWETALRKGGMARLTWADVDLEAGVMRMRAAADKARYQRDLPLSARAVTILQGLERPQDAETLIWGDHRYTESLRIAARAVAKKAKLSKEQISHLDNHAIRHSRITYLAQRSKNIVAIQHLAGHKHLGTTMRYFHRDLENARSLLEELEGNSSRSGQQAGQLGAESKGGRKQKKRKTSKKTA